MNPNHYLAVAIDYLYAHRDGLAGRRGGRQDAGQLVDDRPGRRRRSAGKLLEVPVGFKWFVPGLLDGSVAFGGEESAGASFLQRDGSVWTTDKDGIILCLLASEITAVTGTSPSQLLPRARPDSTAIPPTRASTRRPPASRRRCSASSRRIEVHGGHARRRADHRPADVGAGQRRGDRRAEGGHRERLVRGASVRHRGRLQALRRVVPRPRPSGGDPGRGAGDRRGRTGLNRGFVVEASLATLAQLTQGVIGLALLLVAHEVGLSVTTGAVAVAAYALGMSVGRPAQGRALDRFPAAAVIVGCGVAHGLFYVLLALVAQRRWAGLFVVAALGAGLTLPPIATQMRAAWPLGRPASAAPRVFATITMLQTVSVLIAPVLFTIVQVVSTPTIAMLVVALGVGRVHGCVRLRIAARGPVAATAVRGSACVATRRCWPGRRSSVP